MSGESAKERIEKLLSKEKVNKENIGIWGGNIKDIELVDFLKCWDFSNMGFAIIETINDIKIMRGINYTLIDDSKNIERVRIFGKDGDLDIRTNNNEFLWRYVGSKYKELPSGLVGSNFFDYYPEQEFFIEEKSAFLWGKYDDKSNKRHDNRVGHAFATGRIDYPVEGNPKFVKLIIKTLSDMGVVSFSWYYNIEKEVDK